jgi:hypothetical protein
MALIITFLPLNFVLQLILAVNFCSCTVSSAYAFTISHLQMTEDAPRSCSPAHKASFASPPGFCGAVSEPSSGLTSALTLSLFLSIPPSVMDIVSAFVRETSQQRVRCLLVSNQLTSYMKHLLGLVITGVGELTS